MKVVVHRVESNEDGAFGVLSIDGKPICVTLEEKWRDNAKGNSCIPAGTYTALKYSGTKYKDVWIVENVPNRSAILFHWGNTNDNTAGCILVGEYFADFGQKRGIANSVKTFQMLRKVLPNKFTVEFKDHF
jgi:hypothetical protein